MRATLPDARLQPVRNLAQSPRLLTGSTYGGGTVTPGVAIANGPDGATTAARVAFGPSQTNPGVAFTGAYIGYGQTANISCMVMLESGTAPSCRVAMQAVASGTPITLVTGQWIRVASKITHSNTSIGLALAAVRIDNTGSAQQPASMLVTNAMVTLGGIDYPFGDGSMPGWRWAGPVGASQSVGYPRLA